jgi:DNA-binding CsgD family transcriptional regulator
LAIIRAKAAASSNGARELVMKRFWVHAGLAVVLFAVLAAHDSYGADEPFDFAEFLLEDAPEWALMATTLAFATYAVVRLREMFAERNGLASALTQARLEGNHWRETARSHAEGLGLAIRRQFGEWHLSAGESDVAMLMLKGLSHKEIARLRQTSAATVRQQATVVYQKSGLSSRAELAAFFLEDLFPSIAERAPGCETAGTPSYISHKPDAEAQREAANGVI